MIRRADNFCNNHVRIGRNAWAVKRRPRETRRKFNKIGAFQAAMVTRFAHISDGRPEGNEHESTFQPWPAGWKPPPQAFKDPHDELAAQYHADFLNSRTMMLRCIPLTDHK